MTTGERIKAARKAASMTQAELGAKLGIAYQTVAQWENGLRQPKYETLQKIADALQTTPSALKGVEPLDPMVEFSDSSKRLWVELDMCQNQKLRSLVVEVVKNINQILNEYREIDALTDYIPQDSSRMEYNYIEIMRYIHVISKYVSEIDGYSHEILTHIQKAAVDKSLRHWKKRKQEDNCPPSKE